MSWRTFVNVLSVVLVGLLAGLMLGTGMDQYTHRLLSASGWTMEHQVMDALFRRVLPTFWNFTVLMLVVSAIVSRGAARWLFGVSAVLLTVSLGVTISIEVPMNREIAQWDAAAPPANWMAVRDHWLSFHLVRTVSGMIAFVCSVVGLTRR